MAKQTAMLTARQVAGNLAEGAHLDGGGLYLVVSPTGAKRWIFKYRFGGKRREAGFGSLDKVPLKNAREMAERYREQIGLGVDPIDATKAEREAKAAAAKQTAETDPDADTNGPATFGVFALKVLQGYVETDTSGKAHKVPSILEGLRNEKHRKQWESTLREYAAPIWSMPLPDIGTDDVVRCLVGIWTTKAETASRVRGRIEKVLAAAIVRKLRPGPNPATLKGNIDAILPRQSTLTRGHHPALPYEDMSKFWKKLAALDSISACALRFTVLTAARSGEVRGARWFEIAGDVWTVPKERMKAGKEHRVPLSDAALAALKEARAFRRTNDPEEFIFPSARDGKALSDMTLLECLRGIWPGVTVHGFRSTFRDWAGDKTHHQREIVEQALAHTIGNAVEAAYRRSDAMEKRRKLMADWASFVTG